MEQLEQVLDTGSVSSTEFDYLGEGCWHNDRVESNIFPDDVFNLASQAEVRFLGEPESGDVRVDEYRENGSSEIEAVNSEGETILEAEVRETGCINVAPLKILLNQNHLKRMEYVCVAGEDYSWEGSGDDFKFVGYEDDGILAGEILDSDENLVYKVNADKADYSLAESLHNLMNETMKLSTETFFTPVKMGISLHQN